MLVQFKMKNVLSFKEETIFDMTAISAYKEHPSNLIDIDKKEKFLRVAAIYGANASGKSNFVWALKLFRRIVSQSLTMLMMKQSRYSKNTADHFLLKKIREIQSLKLY